MTPHVMAKTLDYVATEMDAKVGKDVVDKFAGSIQRFVRMAADPSFELFDKEDSAQRAYVKAGLDKQPVALLESFSRWYTQLMFTAYFAGIREALHPKEEALGLDELLAHPIRLPWYRHLFKRKKKIKKG